MNKKGFTLLELLVVVAIIGMLSSIVLSNLSNARLRARDTKRHSEIHSIMAALELYREKNGSYIVSNNCAATVPNSGWCNSIESLSSGRWIRNGATNLTGFLSADPVDPKPSASANWTPVNGGAYYYYSPPGGTWYMIVYGLEKYPVNIERSDGITGGGTFYDYGTGSNGVITLGLGS